MSVNGNREQFPVRKSPRLKGYDYSATNYYFITICTKGKQRIFGTPEKLSPFGVIAAESLLEIEKHFPAATVHKYVVMPNHVHAILILQNSSASLSTIVGLYKSSATRRIHAIDPTAVVWQTSFHDHVIRNQSDYEKIWSYIDANPSKWSEDCFYTE